MPRVLEPVLVDHRGDPIRSTQLSRVEPRMLRAKYDAAQTTTENTKHWLLADGLSARAANSPEVRRILRNRARYEYANNTYCAGMVRTLANDVIGTGPALQMMSGDDAADAAVETAWWKWSQAIRLPDKLRTMRMARTVDGEAFAVTFTNPGLPDPVKLDMRLYEADQFADPSWAAPKAIDTDGIIFDDFGNRAAYVLLKSHPGDMFMPGMTLEAETIPARYVIHLYQCERPGQIRGIPEITPALPLYAQLRRYTLAVIAAAEVAADLTLMLETQQWPGEPDELDPLDLIEIERRMAMTLPKGWKASQIRAEQPTTTYAMFKREIINEIARCLNMPANVAAGDSSGYNYASGRLDHKTYHRSIRVDRSGIDTTAVDPLFALWWLEARTIPGYLPGRFRALRQPPSHLWRWDGDEHVDPQKEANAAVTLVDAGLLTEAEYFGRKNQDWQEQQAQRAKELGVTVKEYRRLKLQRMFKPAAAAPPEDEDE